MMGSDLFWRTFLFLPYPLLIGKEGPLKRTEEGIKMRVQRRGQEEDPTPSSVHTYWCSHRKRLGYNKAGCTSAGKQPY